MKEAQKMAGVDYPLNLTNEVPSLTVATGVEYPRDKTSLRTVLTTGASTASGAAVLVYPAPQEALIGELYDVYVKVGAGCEVKLEDADGNDIIGDNLTAAADQVVFYSNGVRYIVLKDVTT